MDIQTRLIVGESWGNRVTIYSMSATSLHQKPKILYLTTDDMMQNVKDWIRTVLEQYHEKRKIKTISGIEGDVSFSTTAATSVRTMTKNEMTLLCVKWITDKRHEADTATDPKDKHRFESDLTELLDFFDTVQKDISPDTRYRLRRSTGQAYRVAYYNDGRRHQTNLSDILIISGSHSVPALHKAPPRKQRSDRIAGRSALRCYDVEILR